MFINFIQFITINRKEKTYKGIQSISFNAFAAALHGNEGLTFLDISYNGLGNDVGEALGYRHLSPDFLGGRGSEALSGAI